MLKGSLATLALIAVSLGLASSARAASTPERIVFDANVLWHNSQDGITDLPWAATSGPCTLGTAMTYTTTQLGTSFFTHNHTNLDPKLVDPFNTTNPRFDPQLNSPLLCKYVGDAVVLDAHSLDPWFEQTNYVGAVAYREADPSRDWTTGWGYFNRNGGLGRTDINYSKPVIILSGLQTTSLNLVNTNNYLLRGKVEMAAGTTLTIQAGTYLFGEKATTGYLTIDRGAKIMANGTLSQPIVVTSDQDPSVGAMAPGDNGGVVIHGRAIANCANTVAGDSCVSEGGAGYFGGGDDSDNSGKVRYMRVEYAGKEISPDNELNSWTFNACGTGTDFEYIFASNGFDDMFEWFGGTMRAKHLLGVEGGDDCLDWQLGFRGRIQFACTQQGPRNDKGIEADNSEFNFSAPFRSNPIISNITLVGTNPPNTGAGSTNIGVHLRRGTAGTIINSVVLGFRGPGLQLSDPETFANCPGTAPAIFCSPTVTAVDAEQQNMPNKIFMAASPNPFASMTNILFGLPKDERNVKAQIFDARGRLVETLAEGPMNRGTHALAWSPKHDLPGGAYFFRVSSEGGLSTSGKLIVVR